MNVDEGQVAAGEVVAGAAAFFDLKDAPPAAIDVAAEGLDAASFQLISCPTCGQNMQQLPGKKQIDHYRRCVVTAFNQTSQDFAPFLESAAAPTHTAPPCFSSVGEWLQHLDLQQYQRLFLSAGHTMRSVPALTEAQLVALGVPTVGARRRMLNAIQVLKRALPQPEEQPQLHAKKRIKTSAQKAAPTATAATASGCAPALHADCLPQQRSITRVTEKAAEQAAAAMFAATAAVAPAPSVPYLANSSIADMVPLFPGSSMRRVRPPFPTALKMSHMPLSARIFPDAVLLCFVALSVYPVMSSAGRVALALELCRRCCRRLRRRGRARAAVSDAGVHLQRQPGFACNSLLFIVHSQPCSLPRASAWLTPAPPSSNPPSLQFCPPLPKQF